MRIVREEAVRSQEELQRLLRRRGFVVTQPTLSRDIKDLALVKTQSGYAIPADAAREATSTALPGEDRLDRALREFVLSVERAGTLVVIRTPPAAAQPVARILDASSLPGLAGCVAGDDTILVAARNGAAAARLARRFLQPIHPSRAGRRPRPARRA